MSQIFAIICVFVLALFIVSFALTKYVEVDNIVVGWMLSVSVSITYLLYYYNVI